MRRPFEKAIANFKSLAQISGVGEFARRYFIMNAFDGVLTIIGIMIGSYAVVGVDAKYIVSAGIGATIAMAISGFTGTYLTETAERRRRLRMIEKQLLRNMAGSLQEKAANFASFWSALVDGVSPALVSIICLSPFVLSLHGFISAALAFHIALAFNALILFLLGSYLGKISRENALLWGVKILVIGTIVALISIIASTVFVI